MPRNMRRYAAAFCVVIVVNGTAITTRRLPNRAAWCNGVKGCVWLTAEVGLIAAHEHVQQPRHTVQGRPVRAREVFEMRLGVEDVRVH